MALAKIYKEKCLCKSTVHCVICGKRIPIAEFMENEGKCNECSK